MTFDEFASIYPKNESRAFIEAAYAIWLLEKGASVTAQNIRLAAASKMRLADTADTVYTITVDEYINMFRKNIKSKSYHSRRIKQEFRMMLEQQEWMELPNECKQVKWFDSVVITEGSAVIKYKLSVTIFDYLKLYMYSIYGR